MWDYNNKVMEHYEHPRNTGVVEGANASGEVGSIVCGDALKLTLKIENGVITDAKFLTFGCGSAIAAASALTEMVKGKSVEEAEQIRNQDIVEYLGGLPQEKMHCSVMGQEALEAAIKDYRGLAREQTEEDEGEIICKCFGVTDAKIRRVALENSLHSVEEITNYTKAGGGCGSCLYRIEEILDELWRGESQKRVKRGTVAAPMTMVQKIRKIEEILAAEVRPALQQDGGDIELIDVVENKVMVRLMGMCQNCHAAVLTLKELVEKKLRESVDPQIEVVQHGLR